MKKFLCLIITAMLIFCLCGCSNNPSDDYSSDEIEIIYQSDTETVYESDIEGTTAVTPSAPDANVSSQPTAPDEVESNMPDTSSTVNEIQENICYLNDTDTLKNIKLNGRCQKTADGIALNFTASAIEFNTDSTGVLLEAKADEGVYYSVFVDGKLKSERNMTEGGTNYIALARDLSGGKHNIKIVRETESRAGNTFTAVNIQLDEGASLLARDADKVLIEFLGDSMTNGYGNLTNSTTPNASDLMYQNSLKAYPYLLASHFDLDYRMVAMSGIALKERTIGTVYPTFYDFYKTEDYHNDKTQSYTSSNPQDVDIVVVNLGSNDVSAKLYNSKDSESVKEYTKIYTDLITDIGYRKDAKIVFISGVMWCHDQINAYRGAEIELKKLGYNNIYMYDCRSFDSGGGGHPSAEEHKEITDILINFFNDNKIV